MQLSLPYILTSFEQATLEQLVSYKCKDEADLCHYDEIADIKKTVRQTSKNLN